MKINTEQIIDHNGFEINVTYTFEKSLSQIEECHGSHEVGGGYDVQLVSVEILFGGKGIEILPKMNERQKNHIIDQLEID